ncbi:CD63 antigen-like isoform X2 [Bombyx mandarina]|uniref:Tetraspanin n=2 Tax=Bombyx TaxID=7090 RepID=Q2F648_BOMMO|nr:CD63 antigen-like isoform X2 [Bombyx mandarina]ABD36169.1 tetraspanin D [Bombyx mori]
MGCGTSFVKYVLFFFNLVVALLGLLLVGIGVAFLMNWTMVKDLLKTHLAVGPWIFIVVGAVMFVIAFLGCCGAIRESHCMVVTYAIFLLVIIIVQVVISVLLFTYGESIKESIMDGVGVLFKKRSDANADEAAEAVFSELQRQFECCGNTGAINYGQFTLPESCCVKKSILSTFAGNNCTVDAANPGCGPKIGELYQKWNKPIAGVALGVACVEVVGALFALCLANSIRNMDRRYA